MLGGPELQTLDGHADNSVVGVCGIGQEGHPSTVKELESVDKLSPRRHESELFLRLMSWLRPPVGLGIAAVLSPSLLQSVRFGRSKLSRPVTHLVPIRAVPTTQSAEAARNPHPDPLPMGEGETTCSVVAVFHALKASNDSRHVRHNARLYRVYPV